MRLDPILSKASRLARAGKYEAALRILQPEVLRYDRSFNYHYLLGAVCLRAGDFGGALTYLRIAHELKHRDPLAILGLAALFLRRGDTSRAVDLYLEVLEFDPSNRVAKRALKIIRRQAGTETFSVWLEAGRLSSVFPPIPFPGLSGKGLAVGALALAAAFAVGFGATVFLGLVPSPFRTRGAREIPHGLALTWDDRTSPVGEGGFHRYVLTPRQALDAYDRALALFSEHRDEAARIHLNRILESNAADGLKNRARLMLSLLDVPGFDTFRRDDNVSHAQAWQDPPLYQGVHVIWRGIASNVSITDRGTSFDFLLGYDAPRIVEGLVPVVFDHAIPLTGDPLEVLGRIVPVGDDGRIRLEGIAVRTNL
ncbi:MAG: tetratricopeptide repeat protein [Treponema sp.]|nr:tetratricopeptide repeat protein [Treponema sp.]